MKKLIVILLSCPIFLQAQDSLKMYENYDFSAGEKIVFEDNFMTDPSGEFPPHWNLESGQGVANIYQGVPCFLLTQGNYAKVKPYMKNEKYLTDSFSVEYDTYPESGAYWLMIYMYAANHTNINVQLSPERVTWNYSNIKTLSADLPSEIKHEKFYNKWHHIALAYIDDQLKIYVDQYRVLTVPHCGLQPVSLECAGIGDPKKPIVFTNFKVANGAGMNMLDAILSKGRFVTHGIRFDVNSAKIKPESMGAINMIVKAMKDKADMKFEVGGYTDSDGDDASNMKLSQDRADAVRNQLIIMGIDASRLTAKGYGETKPISPNTTPEGKANNRRVEIVKM